MYNTKIQSKYHTFSPCTTHLLGLAVIVTSRGRIRLLPRNIAPCAAFLFHLSLYLAVCNVMMMTMRTGASSV
jgi:hypothetical protein